MNEQTYVITVPDAPRVTASASEVKRWEGLWLAKMLAARIEKHMEFCVAEVLVQGRRGSPDALRGIVAAALIAALWKGGYLGGTTEEWWRLAAFDARDGQLQTTVTLTGCYL